MAYAALVRKSATVSSFLILVFTFGAAFPANAGGLPRSGVLFYSSECYQLNGGDVGGGNFKLIRSATGDKLEVGYAGEGPMEALTATNVRITQPGPGTLSTITYSITIPGDAKTRTFTGTISAADISIRGVDGTYITTPRQHLTYKPKQCR